MNEDECRNSDSSCAVRTRYSCDSSALHLEPEGCTYLEHVAYTATEGMADHTILGRIPNDIRGDAKVGKGGSDKPELHVGLDSRIVRR